MVIELSVTLLRMFNQYMHGTGGDTSIFKGKLPKNQSKSSNLETSKNSQSYHNLDIFLNYPIDLYLEENNV